jgi:hypothetical protein
MNDDNNRAVQRRWLTVCCSLRHNQDHTAGTWQQGPHGKTPKPRTSLLCCDPSACVADDAAYLAYSNRCSRSTCLNCPRFAFFCINVCVAVYWQISSVSADWKCSKVWKIAEGGTHRDREEKEQAEAEGLRHVRTDDHVAGVCNRHLRRPQRGCLVKVALHTKLVSHTSWPPCSPSLLCMLPMCSILHRTCACPGVAHRCT